MGTGSTVKGKGVCRGVILTIEEMMILENNLHKISLKVTIFIKYLRR